MKPMSVTNLFQQLLILQLQFTNSLWELLIILILQIHYDGSKPFQSQFDHTSTNPVAGGQSYKHKL